jgi:IS1 family transposase
LWDQEISYRLWGRTRDISLGKRNTRQIERKHLALRTRIKRLARKIICFSTSL